MKSFDITAFGQPLELRQHAMPKPSGTQVLLKVCATGVCHSDLHLHEGGYDLGSGKRLNVTDRGVTLPLTMGHEVVGEVIALGPEAEGVRIGDVCLVYPWMGCGACPACLRGFENLCRTPQSLGIYRPGGYADHVLIPHAKYLFDIAPLSPQAAVPYACSGLTAFSALKKLGPLLHQAPVAIIGIGGVGLMAVLIAKALGAFRVIAIDVSQDKRNAALGAGAAAAIDAKSPDVGAEVNAHAPEGLLAVIDFVGSSQSAALGTGLLARGGKYIIVGLFGGDLTLPLPTLPMRALSIEGSYTGTLAELQDLLGLAKQGALPPFPVATKPMSSVNMVLADLRRGNIVGRCVIVPDMG